MAEISPTTVLIALLRDVKAASEEVAALFGISDKSFESMAYDNDVSLDPRSIDDPDLIDWYAEQGRAHTW